MSIHYRPALRTLAFLATALFLGVNVQAKLPAASDEAKAKAAEAAAKTSWGNQVANYELCKSMDRVAAAYQAQAKKDGKAVKPPATTAACADPGPFVYAPPAAPAASAAATVAAAPVAPAAPKMTTAPAAVPTK